MKRKGQLHAVLSCLFEDESPVGSHGHLYPSLLVIFHFLNLRIKSRSVRIVIDGLSLQHRQVKRQFLDLFLRIQSGNIPLVAVTAS